MFHVDNLGAPLTIATSQLLIPSSFLHPEHDINTMNGQDKNTDGNDGNGLGDGIVDLIVAMLDTNIKNGRKHFSTTQLLSLSFP